MVWFANHTIGIGKPYEFFCGFSGFFGVDMVCASNYNGFDWVIMSNKNHFTGEYYTLVSYLQDQKRWSVFFKTDNWVILKKPGS